MASGPKKAPIKDQNKVFAPLLLAINQSRIALDINIAGIIIKPAILQIPPY